MSLVQTILSSLSGPIINQIASLIGINSDKAREVVGAAAPAILAAIVGTASKGGGTAALSSILEKQGSGGFDRITAAIGGGDQSVVRAGEDALSSILGGGKMAALTSGLKGFTGLPEGSTSALIGALGSLVMGGLARLPRRRVSTRRGCCAS